MRFPWTRPDEGLGKDSLRDFEPICEPSPQLPHSSYYFDHPVPHVSSYPRAQFLAETLATSMRYHGIHHPDTVHQAAPLLWSSSILGVALMDLDPDQVASLGAQCPDADKDIRGYLTDHGPRWDDICATLSLVLTDRYDTLHRLPHEPSEPAPCDATLVSLAAKAVRACLLDEKSGYWWRLWEATRRYATPDTIDWAWAHDGWEWTVVQPGHHDLAAFVRCHAIDMLTTATISPHEWGRGILSEPAVEAIV